MRTDQDGIWDSVDACDTHVPAATLSLAPTLTSGRLRRGYEGDDDGDGICDDLTRAGRLDECGVCIAGQPKCRSITILYDSVRSADRRGCV